MKVSCILHDSDDHRLPLTIIYSTKVGTLACWVEVGSKWRSMNVHIACINRQCFYMFVCIWLHVSYNLWLLFINNPYEKRKAIVFSCDLVLCCGIKYKCLGSECLCYSQFSRLCLRFANHFASDNSDHRHCPGHTVKIS